MTLRDLFDENVDAALVGELRQRDPGLTIWFVGDPGVPPRGTLDPAMLRWCEEHDFVLVTNNRRTMPSQLADHIRGGGHIPGIFLLNPELGVGETIEFLLIAAHSSRVAEHRDQITYLPHF